MITPQKIKEWLKEVEQRPESATLVLKYVTDRLRELDARNEELSAENIALQSGARVEEYESRLAHLEYQLDLLRRRFGDIALVPKESAQAPPAPLRLLAYNARGRILCFNAEEDLPYFIGGLKTAGEPPCLLAVFPNEELLFLFNSGRVSARPVEQIRLVDPGLATTFEQGSLPDEPHGGELLACLAPLSDLPLAHFFLQISRRGWVKKTLATMAETILGKRFLGKGVVQKSDQPFALTLGRKGDRLALVSREGHVVSLEVDNLSYSAEERIRLPATDHLIAAFLLGQGHDLLALTEEGKVLLRTGTDLEPSTSPMAKGLTLIPPARLEKGTRLAAALAVDTATRVVALDAGGRFTVQTAAEVRGAGALDAGPGLLAVAGLAGPERVR
ncbi:MAG: hypothetical protein JXB85_12185 [Anaerolineales bacterium]|nr:hypothetical protein [Anaerolineales bacterium]